MLGFHHQHGHMERPEVLKDNLRPVQGFKGSMVGQTAAQGSVQRQPVTYFTIIMASAIEFSLVSTLSARLARMQGTVAPITMPA